MEQHITFHQGNAGYQIDFFPQLENEKILLEGKPASIAFMSTEKIEDAIIHINQFLTAGFFEGMEKIVFEGSSTISEQDGRLLGAFADICVQEYGCRVLYQQTEEN